ncbi:MAG: hypothetical protein NC324_02270 [Bacteroides sp.]|nr:hypothetical protein [Bacteroides sp.]
MSVILNNMAGPDRPAEVLPTPDDKLLALLDEDTATKVIRDEPIRPVDNADFEPLEPETPDPSPFDAFDRIEAGDDIEKQVEKTMVSLSALPVDTIVDTLDVTLTEVIVRTNGLEDYEGKDEDKLITSEADKQALVKATERYLDSQEIKVTPLTALLITAGIIYGKKFMYASKLKKLARRNEQLEARIDETDRENQELKRIVKERESEIFRLRKEKEKERKPKHDKITQGDIDPGEER